MVKAILRFVSCCRTAGYRVSTSEVLDCISQLELVNMLDEVEFRAVLRTNFAKSRREQAHFDQLYHLFFHEMLQDISLDEADPVSDKMGDVIESIGKQSNANRSHQAIMDFLSGNPMAFLEIMRMLQTEEFDMTQDRKFNLGPLASRLEVMVQLNDVRGEIDRFLNDNPLHYALKTRQELARRFARQLDNAHALLLKEPRPYNDGLKEVMTHEKYLRQLGERPFTSLTHKELEQVREIIDRLVRKLKDIVSRRYAANQRGFLDVKKTLRKADRYQGVPMEIRFKKKPPRKGKIVALCDISSSVWAAARFMLNILYSLQECFTKVNSFVFVAGLAEVTDIFENEEINNAIEKVLKEVDIDYHAPTDYGETFRHFKADYMDILNNKTTLIIIGDARTNYYYPEDRILAEMREKCRRLIWLNPEQEKSWNIGDSEMYSYKPYCHEIRACRNLNQLVRFVEELVL
ncbi:MAG TPA: VWA domain-containing protein [Deltaproteobacteria bacterium]|nr:VWA domain-containing protein [Deltaproteobacteria bacterium]